MLIKRKIYQNGLSFGNKSLFSLTFFFSTFRLSPFHIFERFFFSQNKKLFIITNFITEKARFFRKKMANCQRLNYYSASSIDAFPCMIDWENCAHSFWQIFNITFFIRLRQHCHNENNIQESGAKIYLFNFKWLKYRHYGMNRCERQCDGGTVAIISVSLSLVQAAFSLFTFFSAIYLPFSVLSKDDFLWITNIHHRSNESTFIQLTQNLYHFSV